MQSNQPMCDSIPGATEEPKTVKNLKDLKPHESPRGFRDATADQIPVGLPVGYRYSTTNSKWIPEDMHSSSHSAQDGRQYVKIHNGKFVEIGEDDQVEDDQVEDAKEDAKEDDKQDDKEDNQEDASVGKKRQRDDLPPNDDKEGDKEEDTEEDTEDQQIVGLGWKTKCGLIAGVHWDGNAQCMCDVCL